MGNPFSQAVNTTSTNPFEAASVPLDVPGAGLSSKSIDTTARMAAIAAVPANEIVDTYNALTSQFVDHIRQYGDDQIRTQIAAKQQADEFRALNQVINSSDMGFDPDGSIRAGARLAADQTVNESIKRRKEYALEQETLKRIQDMAAMGDYTQAKILMNMVEHGTADQVINDINTKRLIMQREVEKAGINVEEQPWFMHAVDFLASVLGDVTLNNSMDRNNLVDIDKGMKNWYDWLFSGQVTRNQASTLWNMPAADFAKELRDNVIPRVKDHSSFLGYTSNTQALNLLSTLQNTPSPVELNLTDALAVGGLAGFLPVGKVASIPMAMVRSGARKEAATLIADTSLLSIREGSEAAAKVTGVSQEEVISNTLPTAMNIAGPEHLVPVTGDAIAGVARGRALLSKIGQWVQSGRMTDQELVTAISKEQERLYLEIGRPLKDFRATPLKHADGSETTRFEFLIGKKKGGGFATKESAAGEARRLGIGNKEFVHSEDGQWFIKETRDLNESGYYTTNLNPGLSRTGILGRIFLGNRQIDDPILHGQSLQAANTRNKILNTSYKAFHKRLSSVSGEQKAYLQNAMAWGENNSVWLSRSEVDELFARQGAKEPASDAAWDSYEAAREVNDIEFALRNDAEWKRRAVRGFEAVTISHPMLKVDRVNALVGRKASEAPGAGKTRIFDLEKGVHYHKNKPLTPNQFKDMIDDGYILVSLEEAERMADGSTIKHLMVKGPNIETTRLRVDQLPYRAGGHRLYADKYFVKQARLGKQPDTGEDFLLSPSTYISGTRAEVETWARTMERARVYVKNELNAPGGSLVRLEEILSPVTELKADDVVKMFKDGRLQLDEPFEAMFDRELPRKYIEATTSLEFVDIEETGFTGWLRTNGRMYYSSKGEALHDWQWERARTVDPFQATEEALQNIANITSFTDYKINAVERWVDTYSDFLDKAPVPKGASKLTLFSEAKLRSDIDKMPMGADGRIKQQMEAQRDIIRRNLGWRTEMDREVDRYVQRGRDFVMGSDPESMQHMAGKKFVDWWEDKNPLSAMRTLAFDMKMGFFNAAQFPLQIQTMAATFALNPKYAVDAMVEIPAMRWYLSRIGNDAGLPNLAKQLGYNETEALDWALMMKSAKQSGFFDIGTSHQLINGYGPQAVTGGFRSGWDTFTKNTRFFFNEGEVWNRMAAWQTAWRETMEAMPGKVGSKDFMRTVALRADDYSMNMMQQSSAAWQHGLASIPTQFWAYQARMIEAYLGKQFTNAQKARLFVSQTFFYGAAGAPFIGIPAALIKNATGETSELNTPLGMLDRGVIDHMIWNGLGADVLAGKRYGTGSWLPDLAADILGQSAYGEKSFIEMTGGATFNIMAQTKDTLLDLVVHGVAESGTGDFPLTKHNFERLAKNISTLSYAHKAYIGLQYQAYITNKGTVTNVDLPAADAFWFGMGMQPGEADDISAGMAWRKNRKEAIKEASTFIINQRVQMQTMPDKRGQIAAETNAYIRLLPPDIRIQALKEANRLTPRSLYEGLADQLEREKTQREILNGKPN